MKILVVHNDYVQHGGEATALEAEVAILRSRGEDVLEYRRSNSAISGFSPVAKALLLPRIVYSKSTASRIAEIVAIYKPDVAHVHNVFPLMSPSVYRALSQAGVPIVQTVHNFRLLCTNGLFFTRGQICERCKRGNFLHAVRFRCYRNSYALSAAYALSIGVHRWLGTFRLIDRFIVPVDFVGVKLTEGGVASRDRIRVLNYSLPTPPIPPKGKGDYFIYLGRLSEEKGIWLLLGAIQRVPSIRLKIAGTGPLEMAVREHVLTNRLENVEILGHITGNQKVQLLRDALASIVPSLWYDVSPLAVVESLSVGTPVIAPRHGGFIESIQPGENGLLFTPGDAGALSDALQSICNRPETGEEMSRRSREQSFVRYDPSAHYTELMTIYREAEAAK